MAGALAVILDHEDKSHTLWTEEVELERAWIPNDKELHIKLLPDFFYIDRTELLFFKSHLLDFGFCSLIQITYQIRFKHN